MKKKFFTITLLLFTVLFVIVSCKKDSSNNTSSGTSSFTISPTGDPSGTYSGVFYIPNRTNELIIAAFYVTPTSFHFSTGAFPTPTGTINSVYYNNTKLPYSPHPPNYSDTLGTLTYTTELWALDGNSTFPSFTYSCTTPMPTFNNISNLPAVINKNQNLNITTSGASDYDQITISINDAVTHSTSYINGYTNATSITFIKDSLTKLAPSSFGTIYVELKKYNPRIFGGKNYLFITDYTYTKSGVVIQ